MTLWFRSSVCAVVLVSLLAVGVTAQRSVRSRVVAPAGGGAAPQIADEISDEERAEVQEIVRENVDLLGRAGRMPETSPQAVTFNWPIRRAGLTDFFIDGISNYVDHNPAYQNLQDWNCGARSYDLANGYGHKGIDIFTWPFGWYQMDHQQAEIVAAAAGTIVHRADGNFDRNCAMNSNPANAVIIQHADGSRAWYWHMKNGSVTPKLVGDTVAQGEYLGVVGSSGSSTGPHLHFEIYNSAGQLQDPYAGPCNSMNGMLSYWASQEPYRNSRINSLQTGSAPAQMPTCPTQETPNIDYTLNPGATAYFTVYYRDQTAGQQTQYSVLRPDGSVYNSWTHNSPNTYSASWWYWWFTMPSSPTGTWTFRAVYNGQTHDRKFALGPPSQQFVNVSGRVLNRRGGGVGNTVVTLINTATGGSQTAVTLRDGSYTFPSVASGGTYSIALAQARYNFGNASRTIMPVADTTGVDLFAR